MNRFSLTWLKMVIFSIFLIVIFGILAVLFLGPCYRSSTVAEDETEKIPAVIYISDTDVSGSDISGSDLSATDVTATDI